jgi:hypothetical protein
MTRSVADDMKRCAKEGIEALQWGAVGEIRFAFLDTAFTTDFSSS